MTDYLLIKWLHILVSTLLFGTGIGSAYYLLTVSMDGNAKVVAMIATRVVAADWLFTATAIVLLPLTGLYLAHLAGWPLSLPWLHASLWLSGFVLICWLPVAWLQIRMCRLANDAARLGDSLPDRYRRHLVIWALLSGLESAALVVIFYLMVAKPGLVTWLPRYPAGAG